MNKILITPRSFSSTSPRPLQILKDKGYSLNINETGKTYSGKKMKKLIKDVDGVIVGVDPIDEEVIETADKLKVISKYGVGLDNIDIKKAREKGIKVTNTPRANTSSVADLAFTLILSTARRIAEADRKTKAGYSGKIVGKQIWGKTLGIIGLGRIGKQVAGRARGFNLKIKAFDVQKDYDFAEIMGVEYVDIDELLSESDFITIHTPLNKNTRNLLTETEFAKMKDEVCLINTARSGIIKEKDLIEALKAGQLRAVALDDFEINPGEIPENIKNKIILTPHMGAHTEAAIENMGITAAKNLIKVLEGETPEDLVK
ncbi:MAG: phosphoglycerate dehydrogenase [Halanaerobiales bacterium]